jgi:hypothetical protein
MLFQKPPDIPQFHWDILVLKPIIKKHNNPTETTPLSEKKYKKEQEPH